jgi:hypothetical protein
MAISFVDSATGVTMDNGNNPVVDLTTITGLAQNDLVIYSYAVGNDDGQGNVDMAMVSAGWTEIADLFADDTLNVNHGVFYKFMGGSPDTTAEANGRGNVNAGVSATAMAFRGVDLVTPFDVASTTATGINTATPNPPSIDHNNPSGVWTVIAIASGHGQGGPTYTWPAAYNTNKSEVFETAESNRSATGIGYNSSPSDPEDPAVVTFATDNAFYCWCAVTMALRPASSGGAKISVAFIGL